MLPEQDSDAWQTTLIMTDSNVNITCKPAAPDNVTLTLVDVGVMVCTFSWFVSAALFLLLVCLILGGTAAVLMPVTAKNY